MSYDIIIRFPDKAVADEWCGQMSDGFGENYCDFTSWVKKIGTSGKKKNDFEKVTSSAPEGTPVFFVNEVFEDGEVQA